MEGVGQLESYFIWDIGPKLGTEFPLPHLHLSVRFPVVIQAFVASFYLIICLSDILDVFL